MIRLFSFAVLAIVMVAFPQSMYAVPIVYTATLNGPSESPPNGSPGIWRSSWSILILRTAMNR